MSKRTSVEREIDTERNRGVRRAKARLGDNARCEVCRWAPPPSLIGMRRTLLHGHHMIPVAKWGPTDETNVIVLCPICHALAHAIGDDVWRKKDGTRRPLGAVRHDLTSAIKRLLRECQQIQKADRQPTISHTVPILEIA